MFSKNISTKKRFIIFPTFFFHSLGLLIAFFKKQNQLPFHLPLHLLRFFTWWSVHASILTIFALVALLWEEKKQKTSWLSQFILLSAALFNLVVLVFCLIYLFGGILEWKNSWFLNLNSITWHFIAPPLTLFCFYFWGKTNLLKKSLVRSILCSWIWPSIYFAYVYLLSWLNNSHSLTNNKFNLYLKKYPYQIFQFLVKSPTLLWLVWLPVALAVIFGLFWVLLGTKMLIEKRKIYSN